MNYIDRGLISSLNVNIIKDFNITNTESGIISSSFMVGYLIFSPIFSYLIYKYNRILLIILGLAVWCISTFLSGFSYSYIPMILSRLFVGVGEAAFSAISPPMIDSLSPKESSSRWFSAYFLAIPVGFALGFLYGGLIESNMNWHYSFIIESIIMLVLSLLLLCFRNFDKNNLGNNEQDSDSELIVEQTQTLSLCNKIRKILFNKIYIYALLSYIFYTFVIGSYSFWGPNYVIKTYNVSELNADYIFGSITISTGIIGTFLGGYILDKHKQKGRLIVATKIVIISLVISLVLCMGVFCVNNIIGFVILLTIGQLGLFFITGPINSIFIWSVEDKKHTNKLNNEIKSLACAICTMCIHLFGDVPSPILVGFIQDQINNWNYTMIILTSFLLPSIVFIIPQYIFTKKFLNRIPLLNIV